MSEGERVCPRCGTDRWVAERFDRLRARKAHLERQIDRLARDNGLLSYRLQDAEAWAAEQRSALQRKVTRQARVIRRLERRLLERGEQPHEGIVPGESAPVSDIPEVAA